MAESSSLSAHRRPRRTRARPARFPGWSSAVVVLVGVGAVLVGCSSAPDDRAEGPPSSATAGQGDLTVEELPLQGETRPSGSSDGTETTPTTEGSGLPPAVVAEPPPGGDPQGIYRGYIGNLAPDWWEAEPVVDPPVARSGFQPLTGLPGEVPERPAAVVKIDNGDSALPQTGLNAADLVVEEQVEGGVTRLAAVFHSTPSIVGPVRSARTTDVTLLGSLGRPLLLYSGANEITQAILVAQPFLELRGESHSTGFWRDETRRAPSNLYTDTAPHWAGSHSDTPRPQFEYRPVGVGATAGREVDEFTVDYPGSSARWLWEDGRWLRWQRGEAHVTAGGQHVSAANVVVVEARELPTGMTDASGGAVPEYLFVGTGPATVFTDGRRIEATWTRPRVIDVATLTDADGEPVALTPGRTWIQLVRIGAGPTD